MTYVRVHTDIYLGVFTPTIQAPFKEILRLSVTVLGEIKREG